MSESQSDKSVEELRAEAIRAIDDYESQHDWNPSAFLDLPAVAAYFAALKPALPEAIQDLIEELRDEANHSGWIQSGNKVTDAYNEGIMRGSGNKTLEIADRLEHLTFSWQPQYQRCPICNGTGLVGGAFYTSALGGAGTSANSTETCRQCAGKGMITTPDVQAIEDAKREGRKDLIRELQEDSQTARIDPNQEYLVVTRQEWQSLLKELD